MLTLALVLLAPLAPDSPALTPNAVVRGPSATCSVVGLRRVPTAPRETLEAREEPTRDATSSSGTTTRVLGAGPSFSAARTLDLRLRTVVRRSVPPARLELRIYTPKGYLYQVLDATPPGPPAPDANPLTPAPWTATLPLAGTAIVNHSLYGRWRVQPHVGGEPLPCGPAEPFWITP